MWLDFFSACASSLKRAASSHSPRSTLAAARLPAHSAASACRFASFDTESACRRNGSACAGISLQDERVADASQRLCEVHLRAPAGVERDASPLHRKRPIEVSQPRVADAGITQRRRIDRQRLEVRERQHPLEARQRLVPARADDAAHAEIVDRPRLLKSIACRRGPDGNGVQPPLRPPPTGRLAFGAGRRARRYRTGRQPRPARDVRAVSSVASAASNWLRLRCRSASTNF